MLKAGAWKFIDKVTKLQTIININDSSASKIKAAFDSAKATLSPASNANLFGYDPAGNEIRYTGAALGKKFDR